MPQIASTLTSDVKYTLWKPTTGGVNTEIAHVTIRGGHGIAYRRDHGGIETPQGMVTHVTNEQLDMLKKDEVFQTHMRNGYVRIIEAERKVEAPKVVKDMEVKEPSAPLTDEDFKKGGRAQAPDDMKLSLGKGKSK